MTMVATVTATTVTRATVDCTALGTLDDLDELPLIALRLAHVEAPEEHEHGIHGRPQHHPGEGDAQHRILPQMGVEGEEGGQAHEQAAEHCEDPEGQGELGPGERAEEDLTHLGLLP